MDTINFMTFNRIYETKAIKHHLISNPITSMQKQNKVIKSMEPRAVELLFPRYIEGKIQLGKYRHVM